MTEGNRPAAVAPVLRGASFSGRQEGAELLAEAALAWLPHADHPRVLDLGSGAGDVAVLVRAARPGASVAGIDFAPANVAAAQARADGDGISFVCADYLAWQDGRFDLIVSDSVLHLIEAPIAQLAAKLAADLLPGGCVVATVPEAIPQNRFRLLLRRLWRCTPAAADRLALAIAARLYPNLPRQMLADRLPYLRLVPRLFGAAEQQAFAAAGLVLERDQPWPDTSLAKLRHRLMVWRRAA